MIAATTKPLVMTAGGVETVEPMWRMACEVRGGEQALRDKPYCHFVERRIPQETCWRMHAQFAFEASPQGNGIDCFRTWEALALGTVPIVRSGPLDRLYRAHGLPVAIVEDWTEVSPKHLMQWADELVPQLVSTRDKLSAKYWTELIQTRASQMPGAN